MKAAPAHDGRSQRAAQDVRSIASQFRILGEFVSAESYGTGHINDTYLAVFNQGGNAVSYIFQRLNGEVFKQPAAVMENIQRVTAHIRGKLSGTRDLSRSVLTLISTWRDVLWHCDDHGSFWRAYIFLENARTYDRVRSAQQAFAAAKAFGTFQRHLADLPPPRLHETIPAFHDTPARLVQLERAVAADTANRARLAKPQIDFVFRRRSVTTLLLAANLPERVTHNDTKLNNVMLDDRTGEGVCVVDLDTVMPGLVAYDFGDMVRTTTSSSPEDETDLSKVEMRFELFEALVRGFLSATHGFLTSAEKDCLALAGKVVTLEIGMRFLTDFLQGDRYFKIHREGQNLDRCRAQFKLVQSIERQEDRLRHSVESEAQSSGG